MSKRIIPLVLTVALVVCICIFPVSAEDQEIDGNTVLNYLDYITAYDISIKDDGYAYISFGDLFTSEKSDMNGYASSTDGTRVWPLKIPHDETYSSWAICQTPGGKINNTFVDLSNIPTGSVFEVQAVADFKFNKYYQTEILMSLNSGISYYDKNFNWISDQPTEQKIYSIHSDDMGDRFVQMLTLTLDVPSNATYCVIYSRANFAVGRSNDLDRDFFEFEFQFSDPYLKISTSYTQIIVNALVNAKPPDGYGTIIDVGDVEDILKNATSDGIQNAGELFQRGPEVFEQFASGFSFMNAVFSSLTSARWISSILSISLALGLFAFITNTGVSIGRALEKRHGKSGGRM